MELKDIEFEDIETEEISERTSTSEMADVGVIRGKKKNKGTGLVVTGVVLFLLSATVLAAAILYVGKDMFIAKEKELASIEEEPAIYTQEQADGMVAVAAEAAKIEQEEITKEDMKDVLYKASLEDSGVALLLREYFPEYMIFAYGSRFEYFPINFDLAPNTIKNECIVKDEETGIFTYEEEGGPKTYMCIDVSSFQKEIDWEKVKEAGVDQAMIRCAYRGYGTGKLVEDPTFARNIEGALEAGVDVGVYFFSQAISEEEALEEARFTLELIEPYKLKMPVAIDVEEINDTARTDGLTVEEKTDYAIAFMEEIKKAGYTPMIYSNLKYFIKQLNMDKLEGYDKWYAQYYDSIYFPYEISVWQYSSGGRINGINTDVDLNISFKKW